MAVAVELDTRARILDAAFASCERYGIARTTLADVAREARLSRQTLYRYFDSRDALFGAVVHREEARFIEAVREAIEPIDDLRAALETAVATFLRLMRGHPLLDKVMASEPQELLPYLAVGRSPVLELARKLMEVVFATRARGCANVERAAETCARVLISYAISPPTGSVDEVASSLAELITRGVHP